MAQHGYLGDDYGSGYDPDYDDDSERGERDRDWRGGERGPNFMFEDRERQRGGSQGRHRGSEGGGFFSRMSDEARGWFSDDDDDNRSPGSGRGSDAGEWFGGRERNRHEMGGFGRQRGFGGNHEQRRRQDFGSHPDDHYRSWRDKQVQALDRDYEEYCREREQKFHQEFDSWRSNRQQGKGGQQQQQAGTAMSTGQAGHSAQAGSGMSGTSDLSDELLLSSNTRGATTDAPQEPQSTVDTDSGATLGTTPGTAGRGRR